MILGFDIGNTNTLLGIYRKSDIAPVKTFRFRTEKNIPPDELGLVIRNFLSLYQKETGADDPVGGIIFSSVVPEVNSSYHAFSVDLLGTEAHEITPLSSLGISLRYDNPDQIGPDRIVNAVAAFQEYHKNCVIVDLGTATTVTVLLGDGTFEGGLIGPGIGITIDALAQRTSKLVKISFERPPALVARNTVDAIKSGFFYGWLSMVEGIIQRIENQYGIPFTPLLTGGFCRILGESLGRECVIDPLLTMKGIKYIYDLNV